MEIAVLGPDGAVLYESLVQPDAPIHPDAAAVHGITPDQLAGAPRFADLVDQLAAVLHGRVVVAFNASFDRAILYNELNRFYGQTRPLAEAEQVGGHSQADEWLAATTWRCAMLLYARWCAEWSDYWGDWRWQPLPGGGHRARADAQATLELLQELANSPEAGSDAASAAAATPAGTHASQTP